MRRYETIVIVDPDQPEQDRTGLLDRIGELIAGHSGYLVERDEWGTRKLAYEIKSKPRGYFTRLDYCGSGELVKELERNFRIDDRFLKYMTVLIDEDVDVEALKEAAAQKEAEEAAAKAEKEAAEAEKKAAEEAAQAETEATSGSDAPAEEATPAETEAASDSEAPAKEATPAETEAASDSEAPAKEADAAPAPEPETEAQSEPEAPAPDGDSEVKEGA